MVESIAKNTGSGACTLWTPWGPQVTEAANPKLASLKRRLQKLGAKGRGKDKAKIAFSNKPECAYEP